MNFSAPPRRSTVPVSFGKPPRGPTPTTTRYPKSAVATPSQVKPFDEEYPVLGGIAAAGSSTEKCVVSKKNSYATLAASWAKTEEENKLTEAKMREQLERQQREEYEIAKRHRIYNSIQAHLQPSHQENYTSRNEDIDEEFDSGDSYYTKPDLRRNTRYEHVCEEEQEYEDGCEEYAGLN